MRAAVMRGQFYFSSSSVVSRAFSAHARAMRVIDVRASSLPLGYPCAKFRFCCPPPIAELRRWEKSDTQSLTQSLSHSPSLFDPPGKEAYRFRI